MACVLLGVLLASPALDSGLLADDVGQRAFILAKIAGTEPRPWWDMFVLVGASPEELEHMRFTGQVPWWTSLHLRIAFFRPLTAATHYLDYLLWPAAPWLMHLHQLAWHGLACGLGWLLFRRLASCPSAAGAAALAFSLTNLHLSASAWLAHRNALLALVFGLLCLLAHDRWRRDQWRPGAVLGPLSFGAALLCGEIGVAALGFVVAHALVLEQGRRAPRLLAVAPYLFVLVIWRLCYDALGYGVTSSGVYLDPVVDPWLWVSTAPSRLLELIVHAFGPAGLIAQQLVGRGIGAGVVLLCIVMTAKFASPGARRALAFGLVAVVLSMVPLTATAPHDRVLVVATIGSCVLFGEAIDLGLTQQGVLPRVAALVVFSTHFIINPLVGTWFAFKVEEIKVSSANYPIAAGLDDGALRRQSLIVLHTPNLLYASLLPASRQARGLNRPNFTWVLHAEPSAALEIRKIDDQTFELEDPEGWLRGESQLLRGPGDPFEVGDEVRTLDYRLRILEMADGRPKRVQVRLRSVLDDPSLALVTWAGYDFERCPSTGLLCP